MDLSPVASRALAALLEEHTGQEMQDNRRWRFGTVLAGLVRELDVGDIDALVARMERERDGSLARRVVEALLNNETYFFRDRQLFDLIGKKILPQIAAQRAGTRRISVWSAGCSTGQEAYSLAMLFAEQEARWAGWTIDIYACDVSRSVVELARSARYTQFQVQRGLSVVQTLRWFDETPTGWQVSPRLQSMVRFGVHNILEPLPQGASFDLVLCRNVLLYFDGATRRRAFEQLAAALPADGLLMLGAGESARGRTDLFAAADPDLAGLYRLAPARGRASGEAGADRTLHGNLKLTA